MRFYLALFTAAVAIIALLAAPLFAFAQDASTTVSLAPVADGILGYVSAVIGALVAAAITALAARLYSLLGINVEARHREALHSAIMTGVNAALAKVSDLIGGRALDVKSTAVAEAVTYVLGSVPDAVRFFGLSEARLAEMVTARLQSQFAFSAPLELKVGGPAVDA